MKVSDVKKMRESEVDLFVLWVDSDWNLIDAGQVARRILINSKSKRAA